MHHMWKDINDIVCKATIAGKSYGTLEDNSTEIFEVLAADLNFEHVTLIIKPLVQV
jgi:hypothetical protein